MPEKTVSFDFFFLFLPEKWEDLEVTKWLKIQFSYGVNTGPSLELDALCLNDSSIRHESCVEQLNKKTLEIGRHTDWTSKTFKDHQKIKRTISQDHLKKKKKKKSGSLE